MKGQHTDLDEIRMAAAYRRRRMTGPATSSLFVRAAGVLDARGLDLLRVLRFTGDVLAEPEGHVVLADEPLLEITRSHRTPRPRG